VSGERWCNVVELLFLVMLTGDVGQVEQQHREAAIQLLPIACASVTPGRALPLPVQRSIHEPTRTELIACPFWGVVGGGVVLVLCAPVVSCAQQIKHKKDISI
jgi:hypothetical protein